MPKLICVLAMPYLSGAQFCTEWVTTVVEGDFRAWQMCVWSALSVNVLFTVQCTVPMCNTDKDMLTLAILRH